MMVRDCHETVVDGRRGQCCKKFEIPVFGSSTVID